MKIRGIPSESVRILRIFAEFVKFCGFRIIWRDLQNFANFAKLADFANFFGFCNIYDILRNPVEFAAFVKFCGFAAFSGCC